MPDDDKEIIGASEARSPKPAAVSPPSASPSATSLVRAATEAATSKSESSVSQKQITIISGLIVGTAVGVWTAATLVFGGQADTVEQLHTAEISRLEARVEACEEREEANETRAEDRCQDRIDDLKEPLTAIQSSLRQCLDRDIQVTISSPD